MIKRFLFFFLFALGVAGCGLESQEQTINTGCANQTAILAIYDGAMQILCGCQEEDGSRFTGDQELTCTVAAGSTIVFQYVSTQIPHQIAGMGTPNLGTSPLNQPKEKIPVSVFSVKLDQTGTYEFEDLYDLTLSGSIVVQ